MGGDGLPGPTDAWLTLAGAGRADLPDPARHAGQLGDVPAARAAGDRRRPGGRDERRPGGAGPGRRLVRARSTPRTASRSRRWASASTGSRSSSRSSPACGRRRPGSSTPSPASTTRSPTRRPCRSRSSRRARRSSWAAGARSAPRRWRPASPTSSTPRSPALADVPALFDRVRAACAADRPRPSRRPSPRRWCSAAAATTPRSQRRAAAIGRDVDEMRANGGVVGTPGEVGGHDRPVRRGRRVPDVPADAGPDGSAPHRTGRGRGGPAALLTKPCRALAPGCPCPNARCFRAATQSCGGRRFPLCERRSAASRRASGAALPVL